VITSATGPLVQNAFLPLMTKSSPSALAIVSIAVASEPALGSEIACAPMISPSISRRR
jgi:hypothetical protein